MELGTLGISQNALYESLLNRFGVTSSSSIPATPGVAIDRKKEGESEGDWPYGAAVGSVILVVDHD